MKTLPPIPEDWLREQYLSGRSAQSIADEVGVSVGTIRNRLIALGVERRSHGAHFRGQPKSPEQRAKMSAARKAHWVGNPASDDLRLKMSNNRATTRLRNGYRWIYILGRGRMSEHRYVMEQKLGRPLLDEEHVHHIDGDKLNNDPSNLELTNGTDHIGIHRALGQLDRPLGQRPTTSAFVSETHKQCKKCGEIKPRSEFSPCTTPGRDPHTTRCKKCCAADVFARRRQT